MLIKSEIVKQHSQGHPVLVSFGLLGETVELDFTGIQGSLENNAKIEKWFGTTKTITITITITTTKTTRRRKTRKRQQQEQQQHD